MRYILLFCSLNLLTINSYAQNRDIFIADKFALATGYIGGEDTIDDEKYKLNGFFVKGSIKVSPILRFYTEYNKQKISVLKLNEVATGIQYTFYDNKNFIGTMGSGIGYMWLDQQLQDPNAMLSADLKLKYITVPLFLEGETKISKHFSYFGHLSYQWLLNYDSKVCLAVMGVQTTCDSTKENANGMVYKIGLRYAF